MLAPLVLASRMAQGEMRAKSNRDSLGKKAVPLPHPDFGSQTDFEK